MTKNTVLRESDGPGDVPESGARPIAWLGIGIPELIRRVCQHQGRHGFQVLAEGRSGQIFFDRGRIIHAEFGEDFGLRAIVEMLRDRAKVRSEWRGAWPNQSSLHIGPDVLALVANAEASRVMPRVDTRVMRRVQTPAEPPPLPQPGEGEVAFLLDASRAGAPDSARAQSAQARAENPVTTMVRVSLRGELLVARGEQTERLADAAAYIHGLARAIASDLGQPGRAAVHLRGGDRSLLVARSEVNDIAAALGATCRLASILHRAGLR